MRIRAVAVQCSAFDLKKVFCKMLTGRGLRGPRARFHVAALLELEDEASVAYHGAFGEALEDACGEEQSKRSNRKRRNCELVRGATRGDREEKDYCTRN